ncbi:MAG: hypothetical protein NVS9B2_15610 [Steroidobacteraceae bacterium]
MNRRPGSQHPADLGEEGVLARDLHQRILGKDHIKTGGGKRQTAGAYFQCPNPIGHSLKLETDLHSCKQHRVDIDADQKHIDGAQAEAHIQQRAAGDIVAFE